jgi:hypothetical protein
MIEHPRDQRNISIFPSPMVLERELTEGHHVPRPLLLLPLAHRVLGFASDAPDRAGAAGATCVAFDSSGLDRRSLPQNHICVKAMAKMQDSL